MHRGTRNPTCPWPQLNIPPLELIERPQQTRLPSTPIERGETPNQKYRIESLSHSGKNVKDNKNYNKFPFSVHGEEEEEREMYKGIITMTSSR